MHFVLDINLFSSIIYMLYEGGRLRPPVVTSVPDFQLSSHNSQEEEWRRKAAGRKRAARSGKQAVPPVPGVLRNDTPFFYGSSRAGARGHKGAGPPARAG